MKMGEENSLESQTLNDSKPSFSLRTTITRSREFLDRMISTAKVHSPFAQDKIDAVDNAVDGFIHSGYQGLKKIAVNGHPAVILSAAAIAGAGPSIPFGPRAILRNAGLAVILASVLIYPDHLAGYTANTSQKHKTK